MPRMKNKIIPTIFVLLASLALFSFAKAESLKIGFVTDWEYGKYKKFTHKLPYKAKKYLKNAVVHYNSEFKPDLVIGAAIIFLAAGSVKKGPENNWLRLTGFSSVLPLREDTALATTTSGAYPKRKFKRVWELITITR